MGDNLIKLKVNAENLGRMCWMFFLGRVILYFMVNFLYSGIEAFWDDFIGVEILYSLPTLIILYTGHEALHVLVGLIVGAKFSSFNFGFDKSTLSIECHCHEEMSIKAYLFILLLPFLVLTPLLTGLAYFSETHLWWLMLTLSTSGCAFDLTLFLGLLGIPGHTRIIPELDGKNGFVYVRAAS